MQSLGLDECKKRELDILIALHNLCEELQLRYFLCYGTLLGAVRHKGFIPWDDDVDICMPRPDYNRLVEYCRTHETPFRWLSHETDKRYGYLFAKAMDKDTVLVDEVANPYGIEMGVYVDIFPLDGLGDSPEQAERAFRATRFERELLVAANWKRFFKSKTHAWYYEPIRFAFFLLSRFVSMPRLIARIEKKIARFSLASSRYGSCLCGAYRNREIMETSVFSELMDMPFEGHTFKGLRAYDAYLSHIYGDYMQLPPEEKRETHHLFTAYRKADFKKEESLV